MFFGCSPPRSGFLVKGVCVVFLPPPRQSRVRTSVQMIDAIAGWVVGERRNATT